MVQLQPRVFAAIGRKEMKSNEGKCSEMNPSHRCFPVLLRVPLFIFASLLHLLFLNSYTQVLQAVINTHC